MPTVMRMLSLLLGTGQEVRRAAVMLYKPTQQKARVSTACLSVLSRRTEILQRPGSSYIRQQDPTTVNMPTHAT